MATVESTVIHYQVGENSWEVLDRTNLVALKTLLIQSPKIHFKAVNTHSDEESFFIADMIFDEAVATTSVTVTREHSKKETRVTTDIYTRQNTSTHSSGGTAHMITKAMVQEGTKNENVSIEGPSPDERPYVEQRDGHDTRQVTVDVQKHGRKGFLGFGGSVKKSYHFSSASSFSRGSENAGRFFTAMAERFKATNPSFTADRSDITASTSVEILAGVNHHQSVEQASSSGPIWQKVDVTTEKHKVHVNPHFGGAVHIHSPSVIVERVNGSGLFPNLHSDSQVQYRSVTDEHERTSKSQKSLTAGAALIVKLAATLAMTTLTGNPLAAEGLMGSVMSAGLNTLCSDAAVCLVQNDGDPRRAMEVLGERNIGKSMLTAMAGAGLTGALGVSGNIDATGLSTSELITAYAKHEMIKAAVNATLAATIDGQDLGQAMLQGIITASISTAAAFGAHKIGDLHKPSDGSKGISGAAHKSLHAANGAAIGALTAAITGDDIGRGAASGGFGALVGTLMTEAMVDDKTPAATAQRITQMSDLITTTLAMAAGLDPVSAYATSHNANEHNFLAHHREYLQSIGVVGEEITAMEEILEGDDESYTPESRQAVKELTVACKKLEALLNQDDEKSALLKGAWCAEVERTHQTIRQIQANPRVSDIVKGYAKLCWQGIQEGVRECAQKPADVAKQAGVVAAHAGLMVGEIFVPFAEGARLVTTATQGGENAVNDAAVGTASLALDGTLMAFGGAGYIADVGVKTVRKLGQGATKVSKFFADVHRKAVASIMTPPTLDKFCLKAYVREVEKVSALNVPTAQRDLLFDALRANPYTKLGTAEYAAHSKLYKQSGVKDRLIREWQDQTGRAWPTYAADVISPQTGKTLAKAGEKYQFHHVIPQEYAGPHAWWNGHPVAVPMHRSELHGKDSILLQIMRNLEKEAI